MTHRFTFDDLRGTLHRRIAPLPDQVPAFCAMKEDSHWGEKWVVYTTAADNSLNPKTRYNVSLDTIICGGIAMVPTLFFYQLGLVALGCVFLMLCWLWPNDAASPHQPIVRTKPSRRARSTEPKPFAGLTQRPQCALCEREATHAHEPPPTPPEPMPPTNRRPHTVDTSQHFCPHGGCRYRGWLGLGNVRANGHPSGGLCRQFHCTACDSYFLETHGTIVHGKQAAVELIVRVLACLAEDLGIRATARVFEVAPHTVLQWLAEAAEQLRAFSAYFLCDLHLEQLQLDELYAVLREVKNGEISEDEAIKRLERSPYWVWTAMDAESKLLVVVDVGCRPLAMAQHVVHQVTRVLASGCVPHGLCRALNLEIRQRVAALGRRVNTLCRGEVDLRDQMVLFQTYHNFVVPHASLRQALPVAEALHGRGSAQEGTVRIISRPQVRDPRANRLTHISTYHTSKSVMDETAHLFLGEHLVKAEIPPDDTEFIKVCPFSLADVLHMVLAGEIVDSMTIIAVPHAARLRLSP
jgi:transposase-like protein